MPINPGLDASGNGNNWATNNINFTTSGVTYDTMTDVPTNTNATTANYCVLNPIARGTVTNGTITGGNLNLSTTTSDTRTYGTFGIPSSGKYYWELTNNNSGDKGQGIASVDSNGDTYQVLYFNTGDKRVDGTTSAYGASYTSGDVIGVAVDVDNNQITFYKNNVSQGAISYTFSSKPTMFTYVRREASTDASYSFNFGQRGFLYTPPSGFVALNTFNLPTPTIGATASTQAINYMGATTYSGDSTNNRVITTGGGADWVWIKRRNSTTNNILFDVLRGAGATLYSNLTNAEAANGSYYVQTFGNTGFTLGTGGDAADNITGGTYVAWSWKANGAGVSNTAGSITSTVSANTSAGFSIVTFTMPSTNLANTVGHGLGVAPAMYIVKSRSVPASWFVYHQSLGATKSLTLNSNNAADTGQQYWNNTAPTSSVFSIGQAGVTYWDLNATMVAYCFSEVAGYSKFGSYTGNGSSDGPFVYTGFRPKFLMAKRTDSTGAWVLIDATRDPYNVAGSTLFPNTSGTESASNYLNDFLSNGFKLRGLNANDSGATFIYMAFAESPFNYSNAR